jgi:hypothetical protein
MQLGIETNLLSFCFPTQPRSEIRIFACLTTASRAPGDLMWMTACSALNLKRNS